MIKSSGAIAVGGRAEPASPMAAAVLAQAIALHAHGNSLGEVKIGLQGFLTEIGSLR